MSLLLTETINIGVLLLKNECSLKICLFNGNKPIYKLARVTVCISFDIAYADKE